MQSTMILDLMIQHHGKLTKMLVVAERTLQEDKKKAIQLFDEFEWEMEKHIFTEEKAIFTSYSPTNIIEGYKMVPELIKEHNEIINKIRTTRKEIILKGTADFNDFKTLMIRHRKFEEEQLYPKLDQELTQNQKEKIIKRITEIVE